MHLYQYSFVQCFDLIEIVIVLSFEAIFTTHMATTHLDNIAVITCMRRADGYVYNTDVKHVSEKQCF